MALRNQPYFPLYVQDYLTDEKLNLCSWQTQGIYIKILCILHKQKEYGCILFKQNDKQNEITCLDFASILIRNLPCQLNEMVSALNELIDNEVLVIDGNKLMQKRMYKDGKTSEARSQAGKKGGGNPNLFKQNPKQKDKQITEDEIEDENIIEIKDSIKVLCNGKFEKVLESFEKWRDYLVKQHNKVLFENRYTYETLEKKIREMGAKVYIEAVDYSIENNYKQVYKPKEQKEDYIPPYKKRIL